MIFLYDNMYHSSPGSAAGRREGTASLKSRRCLPPLLRTVAAIAVVAVVVAVAAGTGDPAAAAAEASVRSQFLTALALVRAGQSGFRRIDRQRSSN